MLDFTPYLPDVFVMATQWSALLITDYQGEPYITASSAYDINGRARIDYQDTTVIVCRDKNGDFRAFISFSHP